MAPGAPTCSTRRGAPGGGPYARPRPSLRPRPFIAPPLRRSPAPTEAPPRPVPSRPAQVEAAAPGAAVGARRGCGAVSALCCRAGRGAAAMARPALLCPPFPLCSRPLSSPAPLRSAPRGRRVPKRSRPEGPEVPRSAACRERCCGAPRAVTALLPRCYRAAGPAAPGDLRGRFVASGPGGRRKSRPRGVTVPRPFGHRRGFPLSSGGVSGSSVTPWGTPGRVCCAVLPERFAPPSHKCPVRPFGSLCHERFGILSGSLCRGRFRSPFTAGALGCFTTLEHKRFGVFREPFFLGGGLFGRPFLGGPFGHGCLEVHWDPQRCCCAPAERRWLRWELHPELLELWAGRGCKPQHGGGGVMPK